MESPFVNNLRDMLESMSTYRQRGGSESSVEGVKQEKKAAHDNIAKNSNLKMSFTSLSLFSSEQQQIW